MLSYGYFSPDAPSELWEMVNQRQRSSTQDRKLTGDFLKLVQDVTAAYPTITNRETRLMTLGVVATHLHYLEVEKFLPVSPLCNRKKNSYTSQISTFLGHHTLCLSPI